jgi:hypothetical protein
MRGAGSRSEGSTGQCPSSANPIVLSRPLAGRRARGERRKGAHRVQGLFRKRRMGAPVPPAVTKASARAGSLDPSSVWPAPVNRSRSFRRTCLQGGRKHELKGIGNSGGRSGAREPCLTWSRGSVCHSRPDREVALRPLGELSPSMLCADHEGSSDDPGGGGGAQRDCGPRSS